MIAGGLPARWLAGVAAFGEGLIIVRDLRGRHAEAREGGQEPALDYLGYVNAYRVMWNETFNTALGEAGTQSSCVGVIKLDSSGKEIYNYAPKDMTGVYTPLTGPVKGLASGHYVEASLPNGSAIVYNPGNTDISDEEKEVIIPLLKASEQEFSSFVKK